MALNRRTTCKGQSTQDDSIAGPSGSMEGKDEKSKEDEASGHSCMFEQRKVKERRGRGFRRVEQICP